MDSWKEKREAKKENQKLSFQSLDILIGKWRDGTFGEVLADWKWILSYSARYKGAVIFYTLLGLISTSLGLVSSVISKNMINIITGREIDKLPLLIVLMVGSVVFNLTIGNIINRVSTKLSIRVNQDIEADIFDKIIDAEWLELTKYSNGDVLNRFNSDVSTISSNAISWVPSVLNILYSFVATFALIWYYDKGMAVLAFGSAPLMLVMSKYMLKKQRDFARRMREMSSDMMTFEAETFYNFDTIKSFGITDLYSKKFRYWQQKYKKVALDYNWFSIWTGIILKIMASIVEYAAFGYCLFRLWQGKIRYGEMTLFLQQRSNLESAFNSIISLIPSFLNASVSAHRIIELCELPREKHIAESTELDAFAADGFEVKMEHLTFSYVEGTSVITESAFEANPGEIVALVGPSGEGKTTMIRLILGLVHPEKGKVFLRASNGRELEMNADTRHLFSYVPQGNTILQGTIAENMRMVKEDASDEEIIEALKIACAWDFVSKMPDTFHTRVGERGRGFSEGQAQRISIARAVLRNSPILLLDEATSALDVTTERQVLRNIIKQRPNKVCIVTTHRPSVLNMCQRVYRVMDTRVTELDKEESAKMAIDF
ncbi:MAG: ABC transporter ATP-binding protein/permease [Dorea sp.]|nr:ABC transporter ATP-binding protein/permease [Dorea sp.]